MKLLISILISILSVFLVLQFGHARADFTGPFSDVCKTNPNATVCIDSNTKNNPQDINGSNSIFGKDGILLKITNIVSIFVGVASVIMIVVGGLKYVLSSGDPNNTTSARNTVIYAIVGLVVAVMAQVIIAFVINKL